jgi:hypothetical protein
MGTTFQGKYSDSIKQAYVYPSSNFLDDLTWGACWLYRKTGEQQFLQARPNQDPRKTGCLQAVPKGCYTSRCNCAVTATFMSRSGHNKSGTEAGVKIS